jgi:predicted subunit of tRNA(5-methylaminomethyl-2-thiouridylate) methyltransferase
MADVVRELQSIADAATRDDAIGIIDAARRGQSFLDRLRSQFVFEVAGAGSPSP